MVGPDPRPPARALLAHAERQAVADLRRCLQEASECAFASETLRRLARERPELVLGSGLCSPLLRAFEACGCADLARRLARELGAPWAALDAAHDDDHDPEQDPEEVP